MLREGMTNLRKESMLHRF